MNSFKSYAVDYFCSGCGDTKSFSEKIGCFVKKCHCNHFDLITVSVKNFFFKLKISFRCNSCRKVYENELNVGKYINGMIKKDDSCECFCCGNIINLYSYLSEQYLNFGNLNNNGNPTINNNYNYNSYSQPQIYMSDPVNNGNINYNYDNYYQNENNNNNINDNNFSNYNDDNANNINNNNNSSSIGGDNIVDFKMKNWKLVFEDKRKGNQVKIYEIYTSPDLKFKNIINSLKEDNPDLVFNPETHSLLINGNALNLETSCNQNNIPSNSSISIILKNNNNIINRAF